MFASIFIKKILTRNQLKLLIYNESSVWIGSEIGERHLNIGLVILTFEIELENKILGNLKECKDAQPCSFPPGAGAIWGPV